MSCDKCNELTEDVQIRQPGDLKNVIRVVKANLADGTLEAEPSAPSALISATSFEAIDEAGPWPDIIEGWFRCKSCGQRFRVEAETYHGRGGKWRAVG